MDMIEKVARAIWDERCRHWGKYRQHLTEPDSEGYDWDNLGLSKRKELMREARAAIAAMREPTEGMIDVMHGEIEIEVNTLESRASILNDPVVYRTMIDAALTWAAAWALAEPYEGTPFEEGYTAMINAALTSSEKG